MLYMSTDRVISAPTPQLKPAFVKNFPGAAAPYRTRPRTLPPAAPQLVRDPSRKRKARCTASPKIIHFACLLKESHTPSLLPLAGLPFEPQTVLGALPCYASARFPYRPAADFCRTWKSLAKALDTIEASTLYPPVPNRRRPAPHRLPGMPACQGHATGRSSSVG
jgi:hypothetical protein